MSFLKKPKSCINRILESNHDLTSTELIVLIAMVSFGDYMTGQNIRPSLSCIANRSKLTRMSVTRLIDALLRKNILLLIQDNSRYRKPCHYILNLNVLAGWEVTSNTVLPVDRNTSITSNIVLPDNGQLVTQCYQTSNTVLPDQYNTNIFNTNTGNELTACARGSVDKSVTEDREESGTITKACDESGLPAPRYAQALSRGLGNTGRKTYKSSTARFVEGYTNKPPARDLASLVPCDGEDLPWEDVHKALGESIALKKQTEASVPRWKGTNSIGNLLNTLGKRSGIASNSDLPRSDNPKYLLKADIGNSDLPEECKANLIRLADIDLELAKKWERWEFIETSFGVWAIMLEGFEFEYYSQKFLPQFGASGFCLLKREDRLEG